MSFSKSTESDTGMQTSGSKESSTFSNSFAGPSCKRRLSNDGNNVQDKSETGSNDDDDYDDEDAENDEDKIEWVEETSDSDPEIECELWDQDCVVVAKEERQNAIHGYHLMPTCAPEPSSHEPPLKQQKSFDRPTINPKLQTQNFRQTFNRNWNLNKSFTLDSNLVELITNPFKCCVVNDFLEDANILRKVREEMYEIEWNKRILDLYEFFQSKDLEQVTNFTNITVIYEFLKNQLMSWIGEITGLELERISATCSLYTDTDYLLLHDDHRGDRLVAFVLYMTDPKYGKEGEELWENRMGGALELFSKDSKGHPAHCVREIFPKNNQLVFFQVTNGSYHQVAEVLCKDYSRYSINGWFHAKEAPVFDVPQWETPKSGIFSDNCYLPLKCNVNLKEWINWEYLIPSTQNEIQRQIEEHSEISLVHFFLPEKFDLICEAIERTDILWNPVGPPNRRQYYVASEENLPIIVDDFLNLLKSDSMFTLLQHYTDLDLVSSKACMKFELQKWTPGCYSLFSDYNWDSANELDLIMYLGCPKNLTIIGGQTLYVSQDEKVQTALITLEPKDNCLNIVYRDTARIVKNVSKHSLNHCYYILVCCYRE